MKKILLFTLLLFSLKIKAQFHTNDALVLHTKNLSNYTISGTIGAAFETVDRYAAFTINQTTNNITLSLPDPTDPVDGYIVTIRNIGTATLTMYNVKLYADSTELILSFKDNEWQVAGGSGNGNCGCCDSLKFYSNDIEANSVGLNRGDYYFADKDNDYGMAWGIVKTITEDVPFDGALPPGCIANVPDSELNFFKDDGAAIASGLSTGEFYLLSNENTYGMAWGAIKKITE